MKTSLFREVKNEEDEERKEGASSLVQTDEQEGWRKKKPSLLGRTPDDESNNNAGHSQYDKKDANLLPGAPLWGGNWTKWLLMLQICSKVSDIIWIWIKRQIHLNCLMAWFTATAWIRSACDSALSFDFTPLSQSLIHQNRLTESLVAQTGPCAGGGGVIYALILLSQRLVWGCFSLTCHKYTSLTFNTPLSPLFPPVSTPPLLRILCVVELYLVVCSTCQLLRATLDMCVCALHVGFYAFCTTHRTDTLYMQRVGGAHVVIFSPISSSEKSAQITQTRPSV